MSALNRWLSVVFLAAVQAAPTLRAQIDYDTLAVVNPWEQGLKTTPGNHFTFARVRFDSIGRGFTWDTDYPESDINFSLRLAELTTIRLNRDEHGRLVHVVLDLMQERIFEYPVLYMVEVGYMELSLPEAERLRHYLLRGGFLLVDDFWGPREWDNWERQIRKVFPDPQVFPITDIPLEHEIFHCVFHLDEIPQIPSIWTWVNYGGTTDRPGEEARIRGISDTGGRLMVVMTYNTDLGDGWEHESNNYDYFQQFSLPKAYPLGINIMVYAMTH